MNELQIFNSSEFGQIRTITINDEPMFCLADVCKALEISHVTDVKNRLKQDGVGTAEVIDSLGRKQNATFINESNLYKTIFQSRKESAERFTDWVTSEVLPSIRKTGSYQKPLTQQEMMRIQLGMIDDHESRISNLENTMVVDYGQQKILENTVNKTVIDALGGKDSNAYRQVGKKVFAECNRDLKCYFNVNSRNNIPKIKFDEAVDYAKNWKPCTNTMMLINNCNAQINFTEEILC